MLDLASAHELQTIRDVAERSRRRRLRPWLVRPACQEGSRLGGSDYNAAGKLVQWLGDALTDVESAADDEARQRRPPASLTTARLGWRCCRRPVIHNGDPDEIDAFARELLAHAEAERRGR